MRDLIKSIKAWLAIVAGILAPAIDQFKAGVQVWFQTIIVGGLEVTTTLLARATPALKPIIDAFINAFEVSGAPLAAEIAAPVAAFAKGTFTAASGNLIAGGESTAANAVDRAATALADAFGLGLSSAAVTAAFEAIFPEKLNTLNGVGPMLAQLAGFADISAAIREPLYRAAFGRSAEYHFNSIFTPNLPSVQDAAHWLARGIIGTAQFNILFVASGLKEVYSPDVTEAAYTPVSPRLLARAVEIGAVPPADLRDVLTFAGLRQIDQDRLIAAFDALALQPYRTTMLGAAKRAFERGVRTAAEFQSDMDYLKIPAEAQIIVQTDAAIWKDEQLVELYRKSISEGYKYGTISDAQYVPSLEAIGIDVADAQAHYAVDSIAKTGKILQAAERAAAALARRETGAAMRAAIAGFKNGTLDAVALEAALLAAGVEPVIAGYVVDFETARLAGPLIYLYGVQLTRDAALVLKENVAAVEDQYKRQLINDAEAASALSS